MRPTPLERFMKFVAVIGECWEWTGSIHPEGYGRFRLKLKMVGAHRAAYEFFIGPIPDGLSIDHLCRNRKCVNPSHLEAVTSKENTLRSPINTAAINRRKTECCRGHVFTDQTTALVDTGRGRVGRRCLVCYPSKKGRVV